MIYTPKFLSPKGVSINATVDNVFSWQSQGEPQTDYQLKIYLISNDSLVYDSTKLTSTSSSHTVPADSLLNDKQYKWVVEIFGATGSAVSDYVFLKTHSTPVVSLTVDPTLTVQSYLFVASYSQAENISIKQFKFILYDSVDNIIEDTGWIYNFTPAYTVDGLLNGGQYQIECQVIDQNNMQATSGKQTFAVEYALPESPRSIQVKALDDEGNIEVNWGNLKQVTPIVTGTSSYVDSKFNKGLLLEEDAYITYSEVVPEYFTFPWFTAVSFGYDGILLEMDDGDFVFGYENNAFYIINQNIKFMSETVLLYNWQDIGHLTFEDISAGEKTFMNMNLPTGFISDYLFIGVTFDGAIIKRNNQIIAQI